MKALFLILGWSVITLNLVGCSFDWGWVHMWQAERALDHRDYALGMRKLNDISEDPASGRRALAAARLGARVAHFETNDYATAIEFYRVLVVSSPSATERKSAQREIARIQLDNLHDFTQAVVSYEKLLRLQNTPNERFRFRLGLAKSHFQLNDLDQASTELDILLADKVSSDEIFEAKSLKANILMARHHLVDAGLAWEEILRDFPERSQKANVALNLVACYEDRKEFDKAVTLLEDLKADSPDPDFLDVRIERLRLRAANQPGAQGLRR